MTRVRNPLKYAREGLWARFNERAGPFTKFIMDRDPERTRLFLENSGEVLVEAWMSDLDSNVSILYRFGEDTWILYSQWREADEGEVVVSVAQAAVSSTCLESVARAVMFLESKGNEEATWSAELGWDSKGDKNA